MKGGDIVYGVLSGAAGVTAIVATRIYPADVPLEVDLPAIYYDVQVGDTVDGSAPWSTAQISVGCLANDETDMQTLAAAVHTALNGYTGYTSGTWLRQFALANRAESRDVEANLWGVLLVYQAGITF